ncbi:MAG: PHP domain-containing protein [Chloroflexi bacterium]|nr:PHP domain-containing protein [Chloroflexota bacterium]
MSQVDLHLHSTASDGRLSPAEVVRQSAKLGLTVIAITDHDSVGGIAAALEAARAFPQLRVIPGVELNTDVPGGEVHVLGYFIDYTNAKLLGELKESQGSRETRAKKMLVKLGQLGIHIDWDRVKELAGEGSIGRPHVAQAMFEKGYVTSIRDAFNKYIGQGGPAYVEREKKTPVAAAQLVLEAGGLPVLGHPFTAAEPENMIITLKEVGLVGMEVYYNNYTLKETNELLRLARKYDLIATGGSDYHGLDNTSETMIGGVAVPMESVEQLLALAKQHDRRFIS